MFLQEKKSLFKKSQDQQFKQRNWQILQLKNAKLGREKNILKILSQSYDLELFNSRVSDSGQNILKGQLKDNLLELVIDIELKSDFNLFDLDSQDLSQNLQRGELDLFYCSEKKQVILFKNKIGLKGGGQCCSAQSQSMQASNEIPIGSNEENNLDGTKKSTKSKSSSKKAMEKQKELERRVERLTLENKQLEKKIEDLNKIEAIKDNGGTTIFERLGGKDTINNIIDLFFKKMLKDKRVKNYFENSNIEKTKTLFKEYLYMSLGGNKAYTGRNLRETHANMKLTNNEFNAFVEILIKSMEEIRVDIKLIKDIQPLIESIREDILNLPPKSKELKIFGGEKEMNSLAKSFFNKNDSIRQHFSTKDLLGFKEKFKDQNFEIILQAFIGCLKDINADLNVIKEMEMLLKSVKNEMVTRPIEQNQTIFQRLGGMQAIDTAVDLFYDKVLADSRVNKYFQKVDMKNQRNQQKNFIAQALGGPSNYKGKDMFNAHKHLNLSDAEFDAIVENLMNTLKDLKVRKDIIADIADVLEPLRQQIAIKDKFIGLQEDLKNQQNAASGNGNQNLKKTLYERIGGKDALYLAVDKFYEKVLADAQVKGFFAKIDMKKQVQMQKDFLSQVLGGPSNYTGRDMASSHQHLKLKVEDFNKIVQLLVQTLQELGVGSDEISEIGKLVQPLKDQIVYQKTLFDKLGGKDAISAAVDLFYEKVLADARVNFYFQKTDMKNQRQQQKDFLTQALGGPKIYKGKDMKAAHQHLKLKDQDFTAIVENLVASLTQLKISNLLIQEVVNLLGPLKQQIVHQVSIFDRIGKGNIHQIAEKFIDNVTKDPKLGKYFAAVQMPAHKEKFKTYLVFLFGGPNEYKGKDLPAAHSNLKITEADFAQFAQILVNTLIELNIPKEVKSEIGKKILPLRNQIVVSSPAAITNGQQTQNKPVQQQQTQQQQPIQQNQKKTIFERIGGADSLSAVVDAFYVKVLADPRVKQFFTKTDMNKQRLAQKQFLSGVLGGPQLYKGKDMKSAHQHLNLSNNEFNAIVELLVSTLKDFKVPADIIQEIGKLVEPLRAQIAIKK